MNIREEIIKKLDKPVEYFSLYYEMKSCLQYNNVQDKFYRNNDSMIDHWFKGVIESLYYRPNKYCLVLVGNHGLGKVKFLYNMLPESIFNMKDDMTDIYTHLIITNEFNKNDLKLPEQDNFKVVPCVIEKYSDGRVSVLQEPSADKRLASYCCTTNVWRHPPRKNFIVLHLESINQELFNSIDKDLLWIEIFNKFKD